MGILDIFRGSKDARIARRLMTEVRALGETRYMEYDAGNAQQFLAMGARVV